MRLAIVIPLVALGVAALGAAQNPDKKAPTLKLSADEQKLLDLTNAERKKEKLPPLKVQPLLCAAARGHAQNMAKQEKLLHELDGKTPFDRLDAVKYNFQRSGENIAVSGGDTTLEDIMKVWMESEGHRANILKDGFTEIGVGLAKNEKGDTYYTQVFATPIKE